MVAVKAKAKAKPKTKAKPSKPRARAQATAPKPIGRPTLYTQELADEICERITNGMTVRNLVALDGMPGLSTLFKWLNAHPEFGEQYARAREARADLYVEEMEEIADDSGLDVSLDEATGKWQIRGEVVQRSRLRVETRARMAELTAPKKYGRTLKVDGEVHVYHHLEYDELLEKVRSQAREMGILVEPPAPPGEGRKRG